MRKIHTSYVEVPAERWLCASGGRCYRERGSVQLHRDGEVPGVHSLIVGSIRRTPVATIQGLSPRVCLTLRPKGQIAVADMSAASITPLFRLCDLHLGLTSCDDVRAAHDGCSVRGNMI